MDNLVNQLCDDLKPVKKQMHPAKRLGLWLSAALAYFAIAMSFIGVRKGFLSQFMESQEYAFELTIAGFISLSAGLASFFLTIPDIRGRGQTVITIPLTLLSVFMVWLGLAMMHEPFHMDHEYMHICIMRSIILITFPLIALTLVTAKSGATTNPIWQSIMNVICCSALGYLGLRMTCSADHIAHDLIYHVSPFALIGLIAGRLAIPLFRW